MDQRAILHASIASRTLWCTRPNLQLPAYRTIFLILTLICRSRSIGYRHSDVTNGQLANAVSRGYRHNGSRPSYRYTDEAEGYAPLPSHCRQPLSTSGIPRCLCSTRVAHAHYSRLTFKQSTSISSGRRRCRCGDPLPMKLARFRGRQDAQC